MKRLSRISALHYIKLVERSLFFLAALVFYIVGRVKGSTDLYGFLAGSPWLLFVIFLVFAVEIILRFFPSSIESMGTEKQFRRNYIPKEGAADSAISLGSRRSTFAVAAAWLLLNGTLGALYFLSVIDEGILVLVSLFYAVSDMICILFFCPFQTWFMKNKCCGSCRIYNWDYAMMVTPLVFIPSPFTLTLIALALALLIVWEVTVRRHPERFSPATNAALSCVNCREKLCSHKRQLRAFMKKNAARIRLAESAEWLRSQLKRK